MVWDIRRAGFRSLLDEASFGSTFTRRTKESSPYWLVEPEVRAPRCQMHLRGIRCERLIATVTVKCGAKVKLGLTSRCQRPLGKRVKLANGGTLRSGVAAALRTLLCSEARGFYVP